MHFFGRINGCRIMIDLIELPSIQFPVLEKMIWLWTMWMTRVNGILWIFRSFCLSTS
ncbi:hypothetical protein AHAS_Ahas13G0244100 [Arachis hypogaea]